MSDGLNGSEQGITIEPQLPQQAHAELLGINPTPLRTLLEETISEERKINSIDNDGYRRSKERLQPAMLQLLEAVRSGHWTPDMAAGPLAAMLAVREKRAEFDPLMADYEILSRGAAEHTLEKMVEMGERLGFPVALARKDLDNFKNLNDTYGHEAGDKGLRRFGKQISQDKRKSDEIARKGGDEFEGYYAGAVKAQMEKRLAESMQAFQRENIGTIFAGLSASIGIADTTEITPGLKDIDGKEISAVEQLKTLAERRMLEAKRQGRNRIITEDPPKEHNV